MANHENFEEKKPVYKKWWFWVIIIILIIIIGNSAGKSSDSGTVTASDSSTTSNTPTTKTEYGLGEEGILGKGAVTVTKVERSQGMQYHKPKSGKEFVVVHLKIENKGNSNLSYNPYDFKVQNSQGQQQSQTISLVSQDTALNHGELIPGGVVTGTIVFEETKGDSNLTLIYQNNIWSSQTLKIKLQ